MKPTHIIALLLLPLNFLLTACSGTSGEKEEVTPAVKEHTVLAVLWQQNAAEYRALCYQAFNSAKRKIQRSGLSDQPLALITDIDETVLDNSAYSGMQILYDRAFDREDWIEWGLQKSAKALPGAVAFFRYADSMGVEVFYISNRYEEQLAETLENMAALGLPNSDAEHVFLKTNSSEKQSRRDRVLEEHHVLMYLGDNLSDLSSVFDGQGTVQRNLLVDELSDAFGDRFIVFPNATYGDWESKGIYESGRDWTDAQRDSIRRAKVVSYK